VATSFLLQQEAASKAIPAKTTDSWKNLFVIFL
jgi:hypothetical protein